MTYSIQLNSGNNYISFPVTSTDNFAAIISYSGITDSIDIIGTQRAFYKFDPIMHDWVPIYDFENIEKGRGYLVIMKGPGEIKIINDVEYSLTFDQLKSKLFQGSINLIGPGSNIISQPNWCSVIDPITGFPVSTLIPRNAYWINYNDCLPPYTDPLILIFSIGLGISIISLFISMKSKTETGEENII